MPPPREIGRSFHEQTLGYWQRWVRNLAIPFEWQDVTIRAAITLKMNAFDDSGAVIADSTQTLLCTYLSAVLLVGLVLNATLGWSWADPIAGLIIAAVAVKEGREAWRGEACGCGLTGGLASEEDGCGCDDGCSDSCCALPSNTDAFGSAPAHQGQPLLTTQTLDGRDR